MLHSSNAKKSLIPQKKATDWLPFFYTNVAFCGHFAYNLYQSPLGRTQEDNVMHTATLLSVRKQLSETRQLFLLDKKKNRFISELRAGKRGLEVLSHLFDYLTSSNKKGYTSEQLNAIKSHSQGITQSEWQVAAKQGVYAIYSDYRHLRPAIIFKSSQEGFKLIKVTFLLDLEQEIISV
ncbi:TPA: hypothetical protein ACMDRK_003335 [Vibrio cholerae]